MTFDEVQSKIDVLKANLEKLDRIPQGSYEEFASDFRNAEATLHLLQTSIQALVDLGSWLVARYALPAPRRSADVLARLEDAGRVPPGTARRFAPIVAFRNRVVHLYDRVDDRRVFEILADHRRALAELLALLLAAAR